MSGSNNADLRNSNVRLCRLRVWPNFEGLGFNLEASPRPPHAIRLVESNSPAAAGGLKILDVILEVNQQDVAGAEYNQVRTAIKNARDSNGPIELLVIEQRIYQALKKKNQPVTRASPLVINTPATMPIEYQNFPKHQPRTCLLRLNKSDPSFGFEVVHGENDMGAYIQEVFPNTPASVTTLQKSDRIIEIDDKLVDKDVSKSIMEKLSKAKTKGAVKLYVMDTDTYKHHQLHKIPVTSKGKRKSQSEDRLSTSHRPYVNERESPNMPDDHQRPPSIASTLRDLPKTRTPSVPDLSRPSRAESTSILPVTPVPLTREDIRLCTINRADPGDTFGIELNYHKKDQFHSLKITPGQDDGPSNAALAGIRTEDRLVEINGQNIQHLDHDQVTQQIRSVKHPKPLEMLVSDIPTYEHYRQQQKLIHRGLPSVRILPSNIPARSASPSASSRRSTDTRPPSTINRDTVKPQPPPSAVSTFSHRPSSSSVLGDLTNHAIVLPSVPTMNTSTPASTLQPRHVPVKKDSLLSNGVGFNFRTIANDSSSNTPYSHITTSVDNTNPIGSQGLRLNDHILSINDENVEYLNHDQLEDKLRRAPNNETMRLLVADGNVYRAYKESSQTARSIPEPKTTANVFPPNRRQYRLQRDPDFEGYGFRVRSNHQIDGTPHQIVSVEPNSPADIQGLRVRDYILRVNNQTVEHMTPTEFSSLMQNLIRSDNTRDGTLSLEVMDENTYRANAQGPTISQHYQPSIDGLISDRRTPPTRPNYGNYSQGLNSDEPYPKMRQCIIRPWPNYRELGFSIGQSPTGIGYQIQQLRLDSPAAHTQIRNGDHLIQVNNINVEETEYQYAYQLINDAYRRDGEVSLLVIDDHGYQWYKQNHFRIDPLSQRANISHHVTPEHQAVYTSTDSSAIGPPMRHTPTEAMSDHREIHIPSTPYQPPSTGLNNRPYPYTNGYISPTRDAQYRQAVAPSVASSLSRQRMSLSRAAVDVVDGKSMLRYCRLTTEPGQTFGFELAQDDNKHVIRNVKTDSPAARAGLHNEDRLINVNDDDVTHRQHRDVVGLIKTASNNGVLRVTIAPSNIKPLNKPIINSKTKSLPSLNDERMYQDGPNPNPYNSSWSPYDGSFGGLQQQPTASPMTKYMSTSRLDHSGLSPQSYHERPYSAHGFDTYRPQTSRPALLTSQPYLPTDPWPRKCVLIRDPTFQGCGFRMIEKDNYDTPIVVEVRANSPAKRSGLTEGDHIIYIDTRNIQAIRTFDEMTLFIQRIFEETGQVTLVTLTAPAYQVLKRKGGYLQPEPFDYQLPFVRELSPRLCKILLYNHEHDFGFTLQRGNPIHIKDVHPGSPAYEHGLRSGDKILELNGRDTVSLSSEQMIEIIESSKRRRQLDILVIDTAGYEFSVKHAVPLNSFLPFVQPGQRRAASSRRSLQEAVYL